MRVLLIKMSSMGDVFHTFPALTDAQHAIPGLVVDWVVEEAFAEIPAWHPVVDRVLPIKLRQWRKQPFAKQTRAQKNAFFNKVNEQRYDLVLDAQGLLKSAWVTRQLNAPKVGLDWSSARERLASFFYDRKINVAKDQHAITRLRELFAKALDYPLPNTPIEYGLNHQAWLPLEQAPNPQSQPYVVCLHGTTWQTKYWPEDHWQALITQLNQQGLKVVLPWGNAEEKARSERLAQGLNEHQAQRALEVWCPPAPLKLDEVARLLKHAKAVVSVDTGLSHVAAALDVPLVVLYRVTDPKLVGAQGQKVTHLCSPLAPHYIKKFKLGQEQASLQGLGVDDVLQMLNKQGACHG
ncbi:ADP-heptose:LPS heptosyl transferase [Thiomicrospira aerophila AL3]|uniref:Lipopolysaccharide heptosyltransferase 1 n=1 Tax=Thiomicrospira aerophila AL3 TaxID=717772 RepID=W0DUY1_9GAMM|nr:lipopolysaccharide heptosyltransferase I [Thiomicrospira aerophila]AHF01098.1 ADP-heptose:LPS heptosyl transferase [Thiomicrospira aerophila AL3]